jgi:hypothetical protein
VASGSDSRCSRHSPASPSLSTVAGVSAITPATASACLNASDAIVGNCVRKQSGTAALSVEASPQKSWFGLKKLRGHRRRRSGSRRRAFSILRDRHNMSECWSNRSNRS